MRGVSPNMRALMADLAIGNLERVKAGPNSFAWRLPDLFGGGRQHRRATVHAAERLGLARIVVGRRHLLRPTPLGEAFAAALAAATPKEKPHEGS